MSPIVAAMTAYLIKALSEGKVSRANSERLGLWISGMASERAVNILCALATDLGFWDPGINHSCRLRSNPGCLYTIGGANLDGAYETFDAAVAAWVAAGKPRTRGNSVWVSEHCGADTNCTITLAC